MTLASALTLPGEGGVRHGGWHKAGPDGKVYSKASWHSTRL